MVTVLGPGGIGKTRLVLELLNGAGSATSAPAHADATFVDLATLAGSTEVVPAVAVALSLTSVPSGAIDALVDRLSGASKLLVLDNCEHVRDGAAALSSDLLGRPPASGSLPPRVDGSMSPTSVSSGSHR